MFEKFTRFSPAKFTNPSSDESLVPKVIQKIRIYNNLRAYFVPQSPTPPKTKGLSNKSEFYDFTPVRTSSGRGDFHFRGLVRQPLLSRWMRSEPIPQRQGVGRVVVVPRTGQPRQAVLHFGTYNEMTDREIHADTYTGIPAVNTYI